MSQHRCLAVRPRLSPMTSAIWTAVAVMKCIGTSVLRRREDVPFSLSTCPKMNTISIGPGSVSQGSSYEACDVALIAIAMDLVESTVYLNRAVFGAYLRLSLHVKSVSNPTSGSKVAGEDRWIILLMCWFHNGRISTGWLLQVATSLELKIIMC